jgi:hypothetical protein
MLHETLIHRVDAQLAGGDEAEVDDAVAVDGIDELLSNLPHAAYFAPHLDDLRGDGEQACLAAPDVSTAWSIRLWPQGYYWERTSAEADADVTVISRPAGLLLVLYNRVAPTDQRVHVQGDHELLARVLRGCSL